MTKPFLGLALSGGTLKAAAHIGVLDALERLGIRPDVIAGTSAGSIVSALYAYGFRSEAFQSMLTKFPGLRLIDYGFPVWSSVASLTKHRLLGHSDALPNVPSGLVKGAKLRNYIHRLISARTRQIPLYVVATDLFSGQPVVFSATDEGTTRQDTYEVMTDVALAVTGSCALPGIFTPVRYGKYLLVDGAMRHYVPVSVLQGLGCQKIIAVNLYRLPANFEPTTIIDVLARSFDILLRESIENDMAVSERVYVLEPDMSRLRWYKFTQMSECVNIGRQLVDDERSEITRFVRNVTQ